jgi:hypothetical protein
MKKIFLLLILILCINFTSCTASPTLVPFEPPIEAPKESGDRFTFICDINDLPEPNLVVLSASNIDICARFVANKIVNDPNFTKMDQEDLDCMFVAWSYYR